MSATPNKFQQQIHAKGLCDERCAAFMATSGVLPGGGFGMVLLAVKGHNLYIYDTVGMKSEIGELLYVIPLREIRKLETGNLLTEMLKNYSLRFEYNGHRFTFRNCFTMKREIAVIKEEAM